jgi:predicted AAA+ superfamily ATPase
VDLEDSRDIAAIFDRNLDPARIVRELSAAAGQSILPGDTLLFLDEIQSCERALTSLKYFAVRAPEYHVIAAGSLLGVALNRENHSFPVGQVDMLTLHPLDFGEFLEALGETPLADLIREHGQSFEPLSLHEKALDLYRLFLITGGMPRPVLEYLNTEDFARVQAVQKNLNDSYVADMAKYAGREETARILAAWSSVPAQLAKENRKFQYRLIKSGARAHDFQTPLHWLEAAGMIRRCVRIREGKPPLAAWAEEDFFKVYMADTGLLCSKFEIAPPFILSGNPRFDQFKGALAENHVCQALGVNGIRPFYWESRSSAELDFVYQDREGRVIPVEVKSSRHVRSKSLHRFMELYEVPWGVRISERNFGFENGIKSVPHYGVFCIKNE